MQNIGPTGYEKSSVATIDGRSRKKEKKFILVWIIQFDDKFELEIFILLY